jgi:peptidase E
VAPHVRAIQALADEGPALAIAGGNVAILLNRLHLFGIGNIFSNHTIFAWSAGAMALTERIVVYHDDPPQGRGNPEVLRPGLGLVPGIIALPHAHRRIRLDRPRRLRQWHHRFAPLRCLAFEDGSWVTFDDGRITSITAGVRTFTEDGRLDEVLVG